MRIVNFENGDPHSLLLFLQIIPDSNYT